MKTWYKTFFRKEVFDPGGREYLAQAPAEAAGVVKMLRIHKGTELLDLCCGVGRHSILFAKRGISVVGFDLSDSFLKEARKNARGLGNIRFVQGDMRRLPFHNQFDAATNLFTSFGYFLDPKDDLRVLQAVSRVLKLGGRFLVDVINLDWLRKYGFTKNWLRLDDGGYLLEELKISAGNDPTQLTTRTIIRPGKPPLREKFFLRLYNKPRLSRLLNKAGLTPLRCWGSLTGQRFSGGESKRLVVLAKKNK